MWAHLTFVRFAHCPAKGNRGRGGRGKVKDWFIERSRRGEEETQIYSIVVIHPHGFTSSDEESWCYGGQIEVSFMELREDEDRLSLLFFSVPSILELPAWESCVRGEGESRHTRDEESKCHQAQCLFGFSLFVWFAVAGRRGWRIWPA